MWGRTMPRESKRAGSTRSHYKKEMIVNYIRYQKEHHKIVGFEAVYHAFLIDNGIEIKEEGSFHPIYLLIKIPKQNLSLIPILIVTLPPV